MQSTTVWMLQGRLMSVRWRITLKVVVVQNPLTSGNWLQESGIRYKILLLSLNANCVIMINGPWPQEFWLLLILHLGKSMKSMLHSLGKHKLALVSFSHRWSCHCSSVKFCFSKNYNKGQFDKSASAWPERLKSWINESVWRKAMVKAYFMRLELSWEQHNFCTEQRDSKCEVKFYKLKE